jgi:hypothetical protein
MTYNDITKTVESVDRSIAITKEQIGKETDAEKRRQLAFTVDYLVGFKNYIKYIRQLQVKED